MEQVTQISLHIFMPIIITKKMSPLCLKDKEDPAPIELKSLTSITSLGNQTRTRARKVDVVQAAEITLLLVKNNIADINFELTKLLKPIISPN